MATTSLTPEQKQVLLEQKVDKILKRLGKMEPRVDALEGCIASYQRLHAGCQGALNRYVDKVPKEPLTNT